jgi:hypothetical protein
MSRQNIPLLIFNMNFDQLITIDKTCWSNPSDDMVMCTHNMNNVHFWANFAFFYLKKIILTHKKDFCEKIGPCLSYFKFLNHHISTRVEAW